MLCSLGVMTTKHNSFCSLSEAYGLRNLSRFDGPLVDCLTAHIDKRGRICHHRWPSRLPADWKRLVSRHMPHRHECKMRLHVYSSHTHTLHNSFCSIRRLCQPADLSNSVLVPAVACCESSACSSSRQQCQTLIFKLSTGFSEQIHHCCISQDTLALTCGMSG